jgi:ferredoxin-thioredoxin reductase catalytic chain
MEDIDIIIENYKKWAEKNGFSINPNKKVVEFLVKSLLDREQKFGKRYCPCRRITGNKKEDEKIVCPCIYMKKEIEEGGRCLCGLFVKKSF